MKNRKKIPRVDRVRLEVLPSNPPVMSITAFGWVPTLGWCKAGLIPYCYDIPPSDGIFEFDFVGIEPQGSAPELKCPLVAHYVWESYPEELKEIVVKGAGNEVKEPI